MAIKIHDQAADDLVVPVPEGWPGINVSGFQLHRSLEKKTDPGLLQNLLMLAVTQVTENFDPETVLLPLEGADRVNFEYAVYELAFAKLIPLLPVHNQLDSDRADPQKIENQVRAAGRTSIEFQRRIPGFSPQVTRCFGSYAV
ncbi:hypothetical protein KKI24_24425 [bacterium]|nr:hypothetical protein [bacterium]